MAVICSATGENIRFYVIPSNNQTSAVPRHREINDFLAQKICRDLGIPQA